MKKKVVVTIISLILVAVIMVLGIFSIAIYKNQRDSEEIIIGNQIIKPDRIVYRDENGKYYEYIKESEKYNKIIKMLTQEITSYVNEGETLKEEALNEIKKTNCIEFDYKTISKNYIIQLEKNDNKSVIRLTDSGGKVVTKQIKDINKIKRELKEISKDTKSYELNYKSLISRNLVQNFEYKYIQQFKEIKFGIYQIKIEGIEEYERFKEMCQIVIDEEITEDTFLENDVILTVSLLPKIDVKVNIGNIKYTYNKLENINGQYTSHILIVNKIVNTDCIYNTDLTEIEAQIQRDDFEVKYDDKSENLKEEVFVKDFDKFLTEYHESQSQITANQAEEISEKGFEEAERICGKYEKSTQKVSSAKKRCNNFFTRKYSETDKVYGEPIEVYVITRTDDMDLNGVEIYIDKKLGKIIGGGAFGD